MDKDITFEQAMSRLEEITKALESDKLPLDDAIGLYKEGVEISAFCKTKLDNAKMQIKVLDENGNEKDFEENE